MNLPAGDSNQAGGESLSTQLAHALDLGDMVSPVNTGGREAAQEPEQGPDPVEEPNAAPEAAQEPQEPDPEGEPEGEQAADEGTEIRKFTDLAAMFPEEEQVTPEDLYGLELVTADDGQVITVGDLKDMYQKRAEFEAEKARFAEEQQHKAQELEEARQQAQMQTGEFQQLPQELREAEAAIIAIRQQARSYDWEGLEKEDPGEAALLRQKFRDAHDAATENFQKLYDTYGAKRRDAWQGFVNQQREKMFQRIPEWRDAAALTKDRKAIDDLVAGYGYTKEEMDSVVDPRLSQLLRDFMLLKTKFDAAVSNQQQVKKRGNKVLRTTFRGKPKARLQQTEDRAKAPNATRQDKHEAMKAILSEAGFL